MDLQSTAKREHPYCKSNSTQCSTCDLQIKIGRRKVDICRFGSAKWLQPSIYVQFAEAGKGHSKA
jgi:hypothetical protein